MGTHGGQWLMSGHPHQLFSIFFESESHWTWGSLLQRDYLPRKHHPPPPPQPWDCKHILPGMAFYIDTGSQPYQADPAQPLTSFFLNSNLSSGWTSSVEYFYSFPSFYQIPWQKIAPIRLLCQWSAHSFLILPPLSIPEITKTPSPLTYVPKAESLRVTLAFCPVNMKFSLKTRGLFRRGTWMAQLQEFSF